MIKRLLAIAYQTIVVGASLWLLRSSARQRRHGPFLALFSFTADSRAEEMLQAKALSEAWQVLSTEACREYLRLLSNQVRTLVFCESGPRRVHRYIHAVHVPHDPGFTDDPLLLAADLVGTAYMLQQYRYGEAPLDEDVRAHQRGFLGSVPGGQSLLCRFGGVS